MINFLNEDDTNIYKNEYQFDFIDCSLSFIGSCSSAEVNNDYIIDNSDLLSTLEFYLSCD